MRFVILPLFIFICYSNISNAQTEACNFHLVVLGSSTAAGSGPSSQDSAWVNKYTKHLKNIDPNYELTNLALGGTTTYHIMPDDFVPPMGRPASNSNRNISYAISLGATAILINMPSNDTSNGFTPAEQLANFAQLASTAADNDIPIWICTTQPKNYTDQDRIDNQIEVRDSILAQYGDQAIDFWTTIADVDGKIDPQYDSGDGNHLNDEAHAIFTERVIAKNLPDNSISGSNQKDLAIEIIELVQEGICGGIQKVTTEITNLGPDLSLAFQVDQFLDGIIIDTTFAPPINECETYSYTIELELNQEGIYKFASSLSEADPNDQSNDSDCVIINIKPEPEIIESTNDTVCLDDRATLSVIAGNYSSVLWYESDTSEDPLAQGETYRTPSLFNDQSFFAEAVTGNLFFNNELFTTNETNASRNGCMFDIIAKTDLTLDSITVRFEESGQTAVKGFYKSGSHKGSELNQLHWTAWGIDTVDVDIAQSFQAVDFGALELSEGDTVGIYVHLIDKDLRLAYNDDGNEHEYENDEISILTGTGINNTFKQREFPRNWNGHFFYHYGFKPEGDCRSERVEVRAIISEPSVDIGADTSIFVGQTLIIEAPFGFFQYRWNGAPGGRTYEFRPTIFQTGEHIFELVVVDDYGCTATDTMIVTVLYPDWDMDGYSSDVDCNDFDATINPGAMEIPGNNIDENCDGVLGYADEDEDGFDTTEDCDDNNPDAYPGAMEIPNNGVDEDCDGEDFIIDEDEDGYNSDEDCDDSDPDINPGADEIPNNDIDEDCDGIANIEDADMDGYNSDEDCNDFNSGINPGATEIPNNGIDENCDGKDTIPLDEDNDGFTDDVDCDDTDPNINPAATEIPNNNIDENCDGLIEIIDEDNDGYNSDEDCDDTDASINPGAIEIANNNIDEDCDGIALIIDEDNDGYNSDEDCNDTDANINPGAIEIANNATDEDCDGIILIIDEDNDGFNSDEDCDDNNASINPDATEIPNNSIDEDCDGIALIIDEDNDGYNSDEDCDDNNSNVNPGASEVCDDFDNNCDGQIDEGLTFVTYYGDQDMDGYGDPNNTTESCALPPDMVDNGLDCDDQNADIYPGAPELANNGIDEDCDGSDWILSAVEEDQLKGIILYPNPSTDGVYYFNSSTKSLRIKVYNLNGQEIFFEHSDLQLKIFEKGVFILSLQMDNKISYRRLVHY